MYMFICRYILSNVYTCRQMYCTIGITFCGIVSQKATSYFSCIVVKCFITYWIPFPEDANFHKAF